MTDANEEYGEYGEQTYFGDCTCGHDPDQHGWGECNIDGCTCEGGWEE